MHLFLENNGPNLVDLWTGRFKGLDTGREEYELAPHIWEEVGRETAEAVKDIPSVFVRALSNITTDRSGFTAESWAFWLTYLAPILLENRFSDPKYHQHLCELAEIMKTCVQFEITDDELNDLEKCIISWVEDYERYYYQYEENRLLTCPLVVHGLLHVVQDIRYCGPVWTTWTFWMERFCGYMKSALKSRSQPWANLNQRTRRPQDYISAHEKVYNDYPASILCTPHRPAFVLSNDLHKRIAGYLSVVVGKSRKQIQANLPPTMPTWGKVRIAGGGDAICSASASRQGAASERDSSFVRYEIIVIDDYGQEVRTVFYGQLERILVCTLPDERFWGKVGGKTLLLALIHPCNTQGRDATKEIVTYSQTTAPIITDL
ncbi:hypothetical protein JAAARDRAFT_200773 [Jaapia argillacea MUCL 33604]|uniref:Uncharacterized protein n=1 Tax=Jaapia argillacea MUCL 33604 TaxID=933084 RepID=A0A067P482_9AGAM|nr:hypothetical protein JAAARDRAFT_200773 [Jaapia argillacea MUCL 33604]